jgi:hypothetical protein
MQTTPARNKNVSATELISGFVEAWASRARRKGASKGVFVLDGAKVTEAEVGSATGLLPLFVWHADNLYRYGMGGKGLGVEFKADEEALLQRVVDLSRLNRSTSELLCFMVEAVEDARQHLPQSASVPGAVELRGLVNQFAAQLGVAAEPAATAAAGAKLQA